VIDLHTHVLPGLDDGAVDLADSVAICRAAADDGVQILAATPHVREDYPTTAEQMRAGLEEVRAAVEGVVAVVPGGEVALHELERPLDELRAFGLAGNPGYLLVETPYLEWPRSAAEQLLQLRRDGIVPVLAHPERNPDIQHRPELLEPVVAMGALVQVTAASVDGRLGRRTSACVRTLVERGLVHMIASDSHSPSVRSAGLRAAADALGDERLAHWLTVAVPGAIVERRDLPPRPERSPDRRPWFGRRR
jgi:protein-tyrosine phosphatase